MKHALQYKTGWLVMGHHNNVRNFLYLIGTQAFSPYSIHDKPIMYSIQDGTENITHLSLSLSLSNWPSCPHSMPIVGWWFYNPRAEAGGVLYSVPQMKLVAMYP